MWVRVQVNLWCEIRLSCKMKKKRKKKDEDIYVTKKLYRLWVKNCHTRNNAPLVDGIQLVVGDH